jgi:hypothetical protein
VVKLTSLQLQDLKLQEARSKHIDALFAPFWAPIKHGSIPSPQDEDEHMQGAQV